MTTQDTTTWAPEWNNVTTWAEEGSDNVTTWAEEGSNNVTTWAEEGSNNVTTWAEEGSNNFTTWVTEANELVSWVPEDNVTWANATTTAAAPPIALALMNMPQVKIANFLDLWVEAVILFGGVIGNCLLFVVISCNRSYSGLPTYLYLKVLSVVDTFSLGITLTTHWVNYNFLPGNKNLYLCKTILFTATQCLDYGACVIAAMAVDRLIAVVLPLKHKRICTIQHSAIVITCVGLVTFIKNIYTFYKAGFALSGNNKQCAPQYDASNMLDEAFVWIDLLIGSVLPFLVIMASNIRLIFALWRRRIVPVGANARKAKKEKQLTALLILVSTTFLLCTLPRKLFTLSLSNLPPPRGLHQVANYRLTHAITSKLWHLNSAINIWLCILTGSNFRKDLLRTITCGRHKVKPETSATDNSAPRSHQPSTKVSTLRSPGTTNDLARVDC